MNKSVLLILLLLISVISSGQEIAGTWSGILDVRVAKMRLVMNIDKAEDRYKGTMDSPDQGAKGIPISSIVFEENKLSLTVDAINMVYSGDLIGDSIVGVFSQMGQKFPLSLGRGVLKFTRPQEPKPPFLYHSEEVRFYNKDADINLVGTLTYPIMGHSFPAVVLITGSGAQDRNEEILGHKPFLLISHYLTNNGVAVLRVDDRGVGASEGDFETGTTKDFATDVLAAVNYLKTKEVINSNKIGLVGHSEGGQIAFTLASEHPKDIAFVVSMAGAILRGDSLLMQQRFDISTAMGVSTVQIEENERTVREIYKAILDLTSEDVDRNKEDLLMQFIPAEQQKNAQVRESFFMQLKMLAAPWMQFFINYDVGEKLGGVTCPVFAINGGKDLQVNALRNIERIEERLGNSVDLKTKIYPNLNHLFQTCETGLPQEYQIIEETISLEVLKDITAWIKMVVAKK